MEESDRVVGEFGGVGGREVIFGQWNGRFVCGGCEQRESDLEEEVGD